MMLMGQTNKEAGTIGARPLAEHSDDDHATWRQAMESLGPIHEFLACKEYRESSAKLDLPGDRIPRLSEVNDQLSTVSRFGVESVHRVLLPKGFYGLLSRKRFPLISFVRPRDQLSHYPEPDFIHDLIGHVRSLAHPAYQELNEEFGRAFARNSDPARRVKISRLYWFTLEFGLVLENESVKAVGAELLSSLAAGRMQQLRPPLRDFSVEEAVETDHLVPGVGLFVARKFEDMHKDVLRYLRSIY